MAFCVIAVFGEDRPISAEHVETKVFCVPLTVAVAVSVGDGPGEWGAGGEGQATGPSPRVCLRCAGRSTHMHLH
jgi:hypothetical protein